MTELQQMFYRELRTFAIIHGNPVQQCAVRLSLTVDQYSWHTERIQAFFVIAGDTGRGDQNSINTSAVEGFDDGHFLIGVVVGGTEKYTESSRTCHFLDPFHNIAPEWIGNRRHD